MAKYVFKDDAILVFRNAKRADPQVIGDALEVIAKAHDDRLEPEFVVEAARAKTHALHKHFEWNEKRAAELYRVDQARHLISSIYLVNEEQQRVSRGFLSITDQNGRSYHQLSEVLSSADLQLRLLVSAERDLKAFEDRYRELSDVCALVLEARERIRERMSKHENRPQA